MITYRWRWILWLAVFAPALAGVVVTAGFLTYMFWPRSYAALRLPVPTTGVEHVVMLAHGVRDDPLSWSQPLARSLATDDKIHAVALDWSAYANNPLRCSVEARRIGRAFAQALAQSSTLASVHLVGHSCGAFVVLGACEALERLSPGVRVQATYLAPLSVYAGMLTGYGVDRFGRCGAFSEAYIDTQDRTPGAGVPLPNAFTFDVTALRAQARFSGSPHLWPVQFYVRHRSAGLAPDIRVGEALTERFPRGVVQRLVP